MTILDTNVISEVVKPSPSRVARWMRSLPKTRVFTTSITEAEMLFLKERFAGRILPFDSQAAHCYGRNLCRASQNGTLN
jgi:predicted nucleic acid-binding protein